jgi:hypothetical protein
MTGTVTAFPNTGTGAAVAGSAGLIGISQGWIVLMIFGFLVAGMTVFNLGRLHHSERRLVRDGRLDKR